MSLFVQLCLREPHISDDNGPEAQRRLRCRRFWIRNEAISEFLLPLTKEPIVSFDRATGTEGQSSAAQGAEAKRIESLPHGQTAARLVIALVAAALLTAGGAGIGAALYRLYPAQTSFLVGLTRNCIRSWSASPAETMKTDPAHTSPGAMAAYALGDC
jgi:hypothetical protein